MGRFNKCTRSPHQAVPVPEYPVGKRRTSSQKLTTPYSQVETICDIYGDPMTPSPYKSKVAGRWHWLGWLGQPRIADSSIKLSSQGLVSGDIPRHERRFAGSSSKMGAVRSSELSNISLGENV